ncbi:hypothetical protein COMNV_01177 [Commensalibacter sp. Nvir]|uniref:hypothetical protein n=1 Tax=Commensalibacter sp. Nvir TaxID=3069817 RepID=UPI002D30DCF7|nr:hypothetical protein COMNV_01177 [Commensalibacter sp. Nvir]
MELNLNTPYGARTFFINKFPVCTGYFIEHNYKKFLSSDNDDFKEKFLFEVLSFAKVIDKGKQETSLSTKVLIDGHLGTWKNVATVFEAVLKFNDIHPEIAENQKEYWASVGEKLAVSFVANTTKLLEPFMQTTKET